MQKEERIEYLDPDEIKPDPNQPRQTWMEEDEEEILQMVQSIKSGQGVIEPIEIDENNMIILGERRWKACKMAGVKVPCRRKVGLTPQERLERQIIADSMRKELSPSDRAWAYATAIVNINTRKNYTVKQVKKMDKKNLLTLIGFEGGRGDKGGQAELSRRTGIPQAVISNYLKIIGLERETQRIIDEGKIPITVATEISRIEEPEVQKELEKAIVKEAKEGEEPKRDEVRKLVEFIKKPEVEIPIVKQKVKVELSKEDKLALARKEVSPEDIARREISKALQPTPEVQARIKEAIETTKTEVEKIKEIPEVKERGKWYANWLAHGAIIQAMKDAACPICGATDTLGWICHDLKIHEAFDKVTKEYQKRVK